MRRRGKEFRNKKIIRLREGPYGGGGRGGGGGGGQLLNKDRMKEKGVESRVIILPFLPLSPNWAKGYCRQRRCPAGVRPGVCQLLVSVDFEENALSD